LKGLTQSRHNAGVGATATKVSAHSLAQLIVGDFDGHAREVSGYQAWIAGAQFIE
jgi:hypothetical protein